jgi:hypothetical protein
MAASVKKQPILPKPTVEEPKILISQCAKHNIQIETGSICPKCLDPLLENAVKDGIRRGQVMYKKAILDMIEELGVATTKGGELLRMVIQQETVMGLVLKRLNNCATNDAFSQDNLDEAQSLLKDL